ncbi:MAG: hypothetical protein N4A48_13645 [Tepidibacter sp.]|uniref:hypothetical protein n=1 Tax=Tepidibacter sp. TaxID=2529387 RepID=UPI0025DD1CFF|nr:hypothetical protein [Tepidibacter sp.]MCT4509773.1 hypothetical protein [Tepidibacter sp.]
MGKSNFTFLECKWSVLSDLGELDKKNKFKCDFVYPHKSNLWCVESPIIAIKTLDKSAFVHKGSGIPKNIRGFFEIQNLNKGEKKGIILIYKI